MNRAFLVCGLLLLVTAMATGWAGYKVSNEYVRSLLGNAATEFVGLGVALFFVDFYLGRTEKAEAAEPLVKLITPAIVELHNDLFLGHFHTQFGIDKTRELLAVYQKNKRNPNAYSPLQRDEIHAVIMLKRDELLRVYDILIDQFRELSMITGWSFDPAVTAMALEARLNFVKFKSLHASIDNDSKAQLIEAYLDGEGAASAVVARLIERLGWSKDDWLRAV